MTLPSLTFNPLQMNALTMIDIARVESVTKFSLILTLLIDGFFISKRVPWQRWLGVFLILMGGLGVLLF